MRLGGLTTAVAALLITATLACAAPPSSGSDPKDALTKELLDLSGTKRQLEGFPQMFNAGIQPQGFTMTNPVVFELLQQASARTLSADGMYKTVFDHVKKTSTADELHAALQIVRNPVALRFTALEVEAAKPEGMAEMQPFLTKLGSSPPEPERVQLIHAIDEVAGGTELVVEMTMASFYATAKAVRASMPKEQQRSDQDLAKLGEAFRDQSAKALKEQTLAGMLFVYRNASTDEIRKYHALLTTQEGQWLLNKLRAGHKLAMNRAMDDLGRDFGAELGKRMAAGRAGASPAPSPAPSPATAK